MDIPSLIVYAHALAVFIPLLVGAWFFRAYPPPYRALVGLLLLLGCVGIISILLARESINNLFLYYLEILPELGVYLYFLSQAHSNARRSLYIACFMGVALLLGMEAFLFSSLTAAPVVTRTVQSILLISFSSSYLQRYFQYWQPGQKIGGGIWIVSAILIHNCFTLLAYAPFNYYLRVNDLNTLRQVLAIQSSVAILHYLLISVGLYRKGKEARQEPTQVPFGDPPSTQESNKAS